MDDIRNKIRIKLTDPRGIDSRSVTSHLSYSQPIKGVTDGVTLKAAILTAIWIQVTMIIATMRILQQQSNIVQ